MDMPESGDVDSELACMVGLVRWRGFEIDINNLKKLREEEKIKLEGTPTAPNAVKKWLEESMSSTEKIVLNNGTKEEVLKEIADWTENKQASERARAVIDSRHAAKEIELYDKLIKAGKFHASFRVIGALSSRMSGSDDLNPEGIRATKKVRSNVTLSKPGYILCGGDFKAFEVSIAASVYNDKNLNSEIESGRSPHGLFALEIYPDMSYEEILATAKTENDKYNDGKTSFFRLMYGGGWEGMSEKLNIGPEIAEKAFNSFLRKFPGVKIFQDSIHDRYAPLKQPGGLGTAVIWGDPEDAVDNGLGFKRYFTVENKICKALFDIANKPPKNWSYFKGRVQRRDRQQTMGGAAQTALYAGAFNIQAKNLRAAANHMIQSCGADLTKRLQHKIWSVQPVGVHKWLVQNMNIHDEVLAVLDPSVIEEVSDTVTNFIKEYRSVVPLLDMEWKIGRPSWAE